jgi:hypothetical protein
MVRRDERQQLQKEEESYGQEHHLQAMWLLGEQSVDQSVE